MLAELAKPKRAGYYLQMIDREAGFSCEHPGCYAFAGREEYCEPLGRNPEEDIPVVVDHIDAILDTNLGISGSNLECVTDAEGTCTCYDIATSWSMHQSAGEAVAPYATRYCLEVWDQSAQATMTEYDFNIMDAFDFPPKNKLVDRPMTPYDHQQLLTVLESVIAMQEGQALEAAALAR